MRGLAETDSRPFCPFSGNSVKKDMNTWSLDSTTHSQEHCMDNNNKFEAAIALQMRLSYLPLNMVNVPSLF